MTKHLLGVAIFISIVTTAAFLFSFLNMPAIPVLSAVDGDMDNIAAGKWPRKDLATRIITAEYDTRTGTLAADIELKWKGAEAPPSMLVYQIHLLDGSQNARSLAMRSDSAGAPFAEGRSRVRRVNFTAGDMGRFDDLNNIYMFIEAADEPDPIINDRERLTNAVFVPILRVH